MQSLQDSQCGVGASVVDHEQFPFLAPGVDGRAQSVIQRAESLLLEGRSRREGGEDARFWELV